ncbi:hypothetical protein [Ruania rhizosphaerae]|uniref:hypothetical protein n=1 Tax=Ruania rhizosphaerae TaxID=1840413 RepID=UPI0013572EF1|nr:hypothetical protein [Ruania rhizosphaerae]
MHKPLGKRVLTTVLMLSAFLTLGACSGGLDEEGQPLTIEQSEQLAAARFALGNGGVFTATVATGESDSIDRIATELTVDPVRLVAWGTLARGPSDMAVAEEVYLTETALAVMRDGRWQVQEQGQLLEQLRIVFALVTDRPENAQLLRQSDARYLGTSDLDDVEMSVFLLPTLDGSDGVSRLWLDPDGSIGRLDSGDDRFVIRVGGRAPTDEPVDAPIAGAGSDTA